MAPPHNRVSEHIQCSQRGRVQLVVHQIVRGGIVEVLAAANAFKPNS